MLLCILFYVQKLMIVLIYVINKFSSDKIGQILTGAGRVIKLVTV